LVCKLDLFQSHRTSSVGLGAHSRSSGPRDAGTWLSVARARTRPDAPRSRPTRGKNHTQTENDIVPYLNRRTAARAVDAGSRASQSSPAGRAFTHSSNARVVRTNTDGDAGRIGDEKTPG
jgi:hypothetical protein